MEGFGKIAVGVRVGHAPNAAFFCCWTRLILDGLLPGDVVLPPVLFLPHANAANALTNAFLATGCDSLLFVDDDMTFAPDALTILRASDPMYAVVGALYCTRRPPFSPIAMVRDPEHPGEMKECEIRESGVVPVDMLGLAFTLVRRSVLAQDCFEWTMHLGEDGAFCKRVQDGGGRIGLNYAVRCGHRTEITVRCNVTTQGD